MLVGSHSAPCRKKEEKNLPGAAPVAVVKGVDRLVDQAQAAGGAEEHVETADDLVVVVAGHDAHDDAHRPGHAGAEMGPAGGVYDGTGAEVRVGAAEDVLARALVDFVGGGLVAEMGDAEQRGDVGVVLPNVSVFARFICSFVSLFNSIRKHCPRIPLEGQPS